MKYAKFMLHLLMAFVIWYCLTSVLDYLYKLSYDTRYSQEDSSEYSYVDEDYWRSLRAFDLSINKLNEEDTLRKPEPPVNWSKVFWFVPKELSDCRDLFRTPQSKYGALKIPNIYRKYMEAFGVYLRGMLNNLKISAIDGKGGDMIEQTLTYFYLANNSFVRNICDTDFNAGHNALAWLSANPHVKVHSFDTHYRRYSKPMADYLKAVFPERLTLYQGSLEIARDFDFKCDIIIIDGDHDYSTVYGNIENVKYLVNPDHHLLIVDDYPCNSHENVRKAWEAHTQGGGIEEHFKCTFFPGGWRGFTVAHFSKLELDRVLKLGV